MKNVPHILKNKWRKMGVDEAVDFYKKENNYSFGK